MLSLYLHIPFCSQVCNYCSFSVLEKQSEEMLSPYIDKLHAEIDQYRKLFPKSEICSIYIGWGTPNLIGSEELIRLIDHCAEVFDCENVGELSFEFNPFPQDEIYSIVKELNQHYIKRPRVRFSFGIQSFDNGVLANSGRPYTFPWMVDFLRGLRDYKQENNIFNFDFIAFGKFNQTKKGNIQLWTQPALEFFSEFCNSGFADSFSLYTLELFENQRRKKSESTLLINQWCFWTEDDIYEEFDYLKEILLDAGYSRYEISNFARISKSSIHNRIYREMENYLGLWLNASSFIRADSPYFKPLAEQLKITESIEAIRFTNTPYLPKYLSWETINKESLEKLQKSDFLIESFFLALRTDRGILDISLFEPILIPNYKEKLQSYAEQEFVYFKDAGFALTDAGMDCYNTIVTEILKEV